MPTETMRSNWPLNVAIVDELELDTVGDTGFLGAARGDLELLFRQRDAQHVHIRHTIEIERHAAPAAADVEHLLAGLQGELGGDVRFLVELGLFQADRLRIGEIGAAILPVRVEEEIVEIVRQIIMMRDIGLGTVALVRPRRANA